MNERVIQFRIGVVVVAAAIIAGVLIMLFGEGPTFLSKKMTVTIKFPQAPGVNVDTPVRKSGVLIGRVSEVDLLPTGGVDLTLKIDPARKLQYREVCQIGTGSLVTGDSVLEFIPATPRQLLETFDTNNDGQLDATETAATEEFVKDGDYLTNGTVVTGPLNAFAALAEAMPSTIDSIETASQEFTLLARNLNSTIGGKDDQLNRILAKTETSLDKFQSTMDSIDELVGDPQLRSSLKRSMEGMPKLFEEAELTMAEARKVFQGFDEVSQKAVANLDHLEKFTKPLGERGPVMVEKIDSTLGNVDQLLSQLVTFSESLNSSEGTLGLLLHDDELYQRLNRTVGNVEGITRKLDPIIYNVRVFTDKIARDPSQLGVKGALDRRPAGTGLKSGFPLPTNR